MQVLARLSGRNGEIAVIEERATGARIYHEAGVDQSYVLPGGGAGLDYVRLMARILDAAPQVVLFGCGGGALATELHRDGAGVTVVDDNAVSFDIARRYFWMPRSIACVHEDMAAFLATRAARFPAIGVDVGGPGFVYEAALDRRVCGLLCRRLADRGRIAINIACDWAEHDTPERIAACFRVEGLDTWICDESPRAGGNAVIVAADLIVAEDRGMAEDAMMRMASSLGFRTRRAI